MKRCDKYYVYMVKCTNGYYYTGYTNNVEKRIKMHNNGQGAKYLRGKGPVELAYLEHYQYYKCALNREKEIKKLTREQKEELVASYGE